MFQGTDFIMLMPRSLLIIKHIAHEGPGLLEKVLEKHSIPSVTVDLSEKKIYPDLCGFSAVITLGGPQSANDRTPEMLVELDKIGIILQENIPYLGICLGMQTLVKAAGGEVTTCLTREIGFYGPDSTPFTADLTPEGLEDPLFRDLDRNLRVFQLHGETVILHNGFSLLATGTFCKNQIVKVSDRAYGIQSHFELTPELLLSWLKMDKNLQALGQKKLLEDYYEIQADYEHTGLTILSNFLQVAEII